MWTQAGQPQQKTREEGGKRYIESTGVFAGFELHMFVEPLLYDERWVACGHPPPHGGAILNAFMGLTGQYQSSHPRIRTAQEGSRANILSSAIPMCAGRSPSPCL